MFFPKSRRFVRVAALALAASFAFIRPSTAAPLTFVYKGAGCTGKANIVQFETVLGRKVDGVTDFLDWTSSWANMVAAAKWAAGCWQGTGYRLNLSVPLAVRLNDGSPLHELAAGQFNTYFTQIAQTLVAHGEGNAYIRLGEEFNYNYYPWLASSSPSLWIQGYRQAQAAMKAVPGANFRFVWNPALWAGMGPDQAYPGDDVVDVMGMDVYNQSWNVNYTIPASRWNDVANLSWGVTQFVAFAKAHNKPYAFPEWGTGTRPDGHGGGDDPYFMAKMVPYVNGSEYAAYWDYNAGDYNAQVAGAVQPAAMAALVAAYGSPSAGSTSKFGEEQAIGAIMTKAASANFTPETPPTINCTNCFAGIFQNAPNHWLAVIRPNVGNTSATVSWGFSASAANLYNPAAGSNVQQSLAGASSANLTFSGAQPLIIALKR